MTDLRGILRRDRWLAAGLIVSLALNAFFLGALATDFIRVKWTGVPPETRALHFEMRWLQGRLPDSSLRQIETAISSQRPTTVAHLDRLRQLRSDLAVMAAAPSPDRAAIDAQLAAIRSEIEAMQREIQNATMDALLALPPEARAGLAAEPER